MDYRAVIGRSIDFIEAHLRDPIGPGTVSRAVFCSTPHLYRVFRAMLGCSIKEYIRRRRLSRAAEALMHGKAKVIDLALDLRYESPECFSRAFRREYGLSPLHFRERASEVTLFPPIDTAAIGGELAAGPDPRIIARKESTIKGPWIRSSMAQGRNDRDIPAFWAGLSAMGFLEAAREGPLHAAYAEWYGEDAFSLVAGFPAAAPDGTPPPAWKTIAIPARRYACFAVDDAKPQTIVATWNYIYGNWFPRTQADRPRGLVDFERHHQDGRCEICIPLV